MIKLVFANGAPNESLQLGDAVYFISGLNTNYENTGFWTGDDTTGVSTMVLLGSLASIVVDNNPSAITSIAPIETNNTFTLYINPPSGGIAEEPNGDGGDFFFFVKDGQVESSTLKGYYSKAVLKNNSSKKAELFAVSCEINESSK
jgi:hypothetical protein